MINDIWSNPILEILLFCLIKEIMWIAVKSQRIYKVGEFGRISNPKMTKNWRKKRTERNVPPSNKRTKEK